MTLKELKKAYEEGSRELSDEARDVLFNTIDALEEEEEPDEDEVEQTLWENLDIKFTYTKDAYDYLENQNLFDFSEAIQAVNAHTPEQIAYYFLEQEIREFADKITR